MHRIMLSLLREIERLELRYEEMVSSGKTQYDQGFNDLVLVLYESWLDVAYSISANMQTPKGLSGDKFTKQVELVRKAGEDCRDAR